MPVSLILPGRTNRPVPLLVAGRHQLIIETWLDMHLLHLVLEVVDLVEEDIDGLLPDDVAGHQLVIVLDDMLQLLSYSYGWLLITITIVMMILWLTMGLLTLMLLILTNKVLSYLMIILSLNDPL